MKHFQFTIRRLQFVQRAIVKTGTVDYGVLYKTMTQWRYNSNGSLETAAWSFVPEWFPDSFWLSYSPRTYTQY